MGDGYHVPIVALSAAGGSGRGLRFGTRRPVLPANDVLDLQRLVGDARQCSGNVVVELHRRNCSTANEFGAATVATPF